MGNSREETQLLVLEAIQDGASGGATAANQVTEIAKLTSLDGKAPSLVSGRVPVDGSGVTQPISAASLPLPTGAALDATLTGGTQKAILRGGAKGATTAADVTSTANGADHQATDTAEQFQSTAEDNVAQRILVEQRNSFTNITSATTTTVKSGAGFFKGLVINKGVAAATITIYDNTTNSGTKIGTVTFGGSLLTDPPWTADYNVSFATGLTIVTSGATDITVAYR